MITADSGVPRGGGAVGALAPPKMS